MADRLRLSPQTAAVLDAFLGSPRAWRYGYDISRDTELRSGTLYPILMRLADREWLETSWETSDSGRPPRHMYRLTADGVRAARGYMREYHAHHVRRPALREAKT
ncbi:MAG TPA: helix-turn-helix transcriptional regulator [Gemmatimonadaceae bacterium]|nr:helix-turn-helix transcriptional regulator [Gemmatimonadaceae bacterium]